MDGHSEGLPEVTLPSRQSCGPWGRRPSPCLVHGHSREAPPPRDAESPPAQQGLVNKSSVLSGSNGVQASRHSVTQADAGWGGIHTGLGTQDDSACKPAAFRCVGREADRSRLGPQRTGPQVGSPSPAPGVSVAGPSVLCGLGSTPGTGLLQSGDKVQGVWPLLSQMSLVQWATPPWDLTSWPVSCQFRQQIFLA